MPIRIESWQSEATGHLFDSRQAALEDESVNGPYLQLLQDRIASGKPWEPRVGDWIYVGSHFYIDHGEDDVVGGLATIAAIGKFGVILNEHPGTEYNWRILLDEQKKLQAEYQLTWAHPDPDLG